MSLVSCMYLNVALDKYGNNLDNPVDKCLLLCGDKVSNSWYSKFGLLKSFQKKLQRNSQSFLG